MKKKPCILIVDDEKLLRELIKAFFSDCGYNVIEAEDGVDAFNVMKKNDVDVAIIDMKMPRMGGVELMKRLRETGKKFPFIVITAYSPSEVNDEEYNTVEKEISEFVKKPFHILELEKTVKRVLEKKSRAA